MEGFFFLFFPLFLILSPHFFFFFSIFFFLLSLTRRHNSVSSLCVSVETLGDCHSSTWEPNLENKSSVSCGYLLKDVGRHLVGIQKVRGRSIPSEAVGIWHLSWKSILKNSQISFCKLGLMLLITVKGGGIFLLWCNGAFDLCYFLVDKLKEVEGKQQKWLWGWRDWRKRKIKALYLCSFYKISRRAGLLWASEGYKCQGMEGVEEGNWVSTLQVLVQAGSFTHCLIQKENFHRTLGVLHRCAGEEQKYFVWQQGRYLLWYFNQGKALKSAVVCTSHWLASINVITSDKSCFPFVPAFPDRRSFRKLRFRPR